MKWFYDRKIATKLILSFIVVALIAGIIGYFGIKDIHNILVEDTDMYQRNTVPLGDMGDVSTAFQRIRVNLRDLVLADSVDRQKYVDSIDSLDKEMDQSLVEFEKSIADQQVRAEFERLQAALAAYKPIQENIISLTMANQVDQALAQLRGHAKEANDVDEAIQKLFELKIALAQQKSENNIALAGAATKTMITLVVIGVLLAIGLGLFVARIISKPLAILTGAAEKLAMGDVNVSVEAATKDELGELSKSFQDMVGTISGLVKEANLLTEAAKDGKLRIRGNAAQFTGAWAQVITGVNDTLDAVVDPLNMAAECVERISKGDIPSKITDNYNGDFNQIKNNLNTCIDAINALIADTSMLSAEALEGRLDTRAEVRKHGGDFRRIVEGVNNTLDAVIKPVQEAAGVLQEMSGGNLQVKVAGDYRGDHAVIKDALNQTLDALNEVLHEINAASEQVASGATQVSDSSQSLSRASTEQASTIEEVTASMSQIATQTKQNALNASQANELAVTVKENASQGNSQMQDMLKAMEEINESSSNISKIIKVIDEIAFQTNILALNAAVEAARAGQHGKGFAVVAEEVRNLAARSANAAKETTVMIEGSIKKVEAGTGIATDTARALNQIVDGVTQVTALVGDIAVASNEQATAIVQINQGIAQVAEVTQMNTATSEESAAASEELADQANLLKERVSRFKLRKAGNSLSGLPGVNPEVLRMLETMAEKQSKAREEKGEAGKAEAAAAHPKPRISLDDHEFGKY